MRFGVLVNPTNPNAQANTTEGGAAASAIGAQFEIISTRTNGDIVSVFATLVKNRTECTSGQPRTVADQPSRPRREVGRTPCGADQFIPFGSSRTSAD
jgi:hypothetical protein